MSSAHTQVTKHPDCHLFVDFGDGGDTESDTYVLNVLTGLRDSGTNAVVPFNEEYALGLLHDCGLVMSRKGLPRDNKGVADVNEALLSMHSQWATREIPPQKPTNSPRRPSGAGVASGFGNYTRIYINTGDAGHNFFGLLTKSVVAGETNSNQLSVSTGPGLARDDFQIQLSEDGLTMSLSARRAIRMCGAHAPSSRQPDDALWAQLLDAYRECSRDLSDTDQSKSLTRRQLEVCRDKIMLAGFDALASHVEATVRAFGDVGSAHSTCCRYREGLPPVDDSQTVVLHKGKIKRPNRK